MNVDYRDDTDKVGLLITKLKFLSLFISLNAIRFDLRCVNRRHQASIFRASIAELRVKIKTTGPFHQL